jgi:cyanuric acid amidohydrolase
MLDDTDINAQRHIRGAIAGLVAGVLGDTRIFVSGGAEHQGPDGGGLIAVIAERSERSGNDKRETSGGARCAS